ncbi:MAG: hypothetical protein ABI191_00310 [Rhizomicrobium sp.]
MDKEDVRLLVGLGIGVAGVGVQMIGAPHSLGWAIVFGGVGVAIYPWAARQLNPELTHHAANDLRNANQEQVAPPQVLLAPSTLSPLVPDWPIRELVRHIKPDVLDTKSQDEFEAVQDDVLDKLSVGQIAAWGRVVATHRSSLTLIPADYWQHAKLNIWLLDEDGGDVLQAAPRSSRVNQPQYREIWINRAQALSIWPATAHSNDDEISVRDAMFYVLYRKWPGPEDELTEVSPAFDSLEKLRRAAAVANLKILGVEYNGQIPFQIEPSFWIDHRISLETVFQPENERIKTESATGMPAQGRFKHLQVMKTEVEALWPTTPLRASSGPSASLSMVVTRINQPLRDAARLAFEAIQGTNSENILSDLYPTAEERLSYFISDMAGQDLQHYGKKPPSSVAVKIPGKDVLRMHSVDGQNALIETFDKHPTYVEVTVDGEDLRAYLDKLKTRYP